MRVIRALTVGLMLLTPAAGLTQASGMRLGNFSYDSGSAVEVTADSLNVDQATGVAIFSGNVIIGQGDLRIAAGEVQVVYAAETGAIAKLVATGGVTFTTPNEAAEAAEAVYDLASGFMTLTGSVLFSQGASALSADKMTITLADGSVRMEGNVRTILAQPVN